MEQHWLSDAPLAPEQLDALLTSPLHADWQTPEETHITLLDTFGWALWHSGKLLRRIGKHRLQLVDTQGTLIAEAALKHTPRFWWQLPLGDWQKCLKPITELWSFNPVAAFSQSVQTIDIRNDDGKTVARLRQTTCSGCPQIHYSLIGLRGYEQHFDEIRKSLPDAGGEVEASALPDTHWLLACATPSKIDKLPHFALQPQQNAESAVRQMMIAMLDQARLFEAGILDDIDTEFLHQYRVSIRKARSLVTLMGGVLSKETKYALKQGFKQLAGPTGELRDMDVFLLARDDYARLLPAGFEDGLDSLFNAATKDRRRALSQVRRWLRSNTYQQVVDNLASELQRPAQLATKTSTKPVATVLAKRARKSFRTIQTLGTAIDDTTADEEIHALRIECKKMRYLMEHFAEILPPKPTMKFVKSLKRLQTLLGDFNDFAVQQQFLKHYADGHSTSPALSAATGGMIAVLHRLHTETRQQVQAAFADFHTAEVEATFATIFSGAKPG